MAYQTEQMQKVLTVMAVVLPEWYLKNKRELPWRETGNPYDVWLSEIMLQQTRVEAVKGYFYRFKEALPEIRDLAACADDRLMKLWEGLGYYSRARNLKKTAGILMETYHGKLPETEEALRKLPGIGPYTAGAIASIAFGQRVPAVDGNVLRVCMRAAGDEADIALPETRKWLEKQLRECMPQENPGCFNQALMELGAIVCIPNGQPLCEICPLHAVCRTRAENLWQSLPCKSSKKERRREEKTVLLIQNGDRAMVRKRGARGLLAGLWEFPSLEGYRTEQEVLEWLYEQGLDPLQIEKLPAAKHIFTHVEWHMQGYRIKLPADTVCEEVFADAEELEESYALPSAFQAYRKELPVRS